MRINGSLTSGLCSVWETVQYLTFQAKDNLIKQKA